MKPMTRNFLIWTPRILSILLASLFGLAALWMVLHMPPDQSNLSPKALELFKDQFNFPPEALEISKDPALFESFLWKTRIMVFIPALLLLCTLALAWKWAWVGGSSFTIFGFLGLILTTLGEIHFGFWLMIFLAFSLIGLLFLASWFYGTSRVTPNQV